MDHDEILENRTTLAQSPSIKPDGDCCRDDLVFALRDKHHTFSLNMGTILQCLRLAEHEGAVPELPEGWWSRISRRYTLG
ncbi:hypothetical protein AWM79_12090 [Pseudomonas agarici]|uniref:Uncharacterized protein n=1 Tax=Pseudomonas agarici TaxID=46677 RepID=A0A0X1T2C1_PSEAA|nr:hypothetical protein AWM79_12090 [Pseudomonas agarici]